MSAFWGTPQLTSYKYGPLGRVLLGWKKEKEKKTKSSGLEVRDGSCDPLLDGEDVVDDDDADDEAEEEDENERGIE